MEAGPIFPALAAAVSAVTVGCAAEIPTYDDDPKTEVCGGAVCFAPEHVEVRRWGDGDVTVAAWRGTDGCLLPQTGRDATPGQALVIELRRAHAGDRLPIVPHDRMDETDGGFVVARSVRVDPSTRKTIADEEAVSGEATVLDLDPRTGGLRIRLRARWSSGVSSETLLDVAGWPGCGADEQ